MGIIRQLKTLFSRKEKMSDSDIVSLKSEDLGDYNIRVTATFANRSQSSVVYEGVSPEAAQALKDRNLARAAELKAQKAKAAKQ